MLTLNWSKRDAHNRAACGVPHRLLEEASNLSVGEPDSGNILIHGDNPEALNALLPGGLGVFTSTRRSTLVKPLSTIMTRPSARLGPA